MNPKVRKNIAIILARKNSKRIKNKNLIRIDGKPLIEHSINCAKESKLIDDIFVSSDSEEVKKICEKLEVNFINRSKRLSGDFIHSDEVLVDVIKKLNKNIKINLVIFLQPTSPLRPQKILDKAIAFFKKNKADSLFSSTLFKNHIWSQNSILKAINYNYKKRTFEQEKNNQFNENGSFYIFKSSKFLKSKNRLFGKKIHFEIPYIYSFQIDEILDISIINFLFTLEKKNITNYKI